MQEQGWIFPFCPQPDAWSVDWDHFYTHYSWLRAMEGVQQSPIYHAEGDVCIHTRMVAEAMTALPGWRALPAEERSLLFLAALLHDVAKPACTRVEPDGQITSKGHARKGEQMTRTILLDGSELDPVPLEQREYIARLVRFHGLPLHFWDREPPERRIIEASQNIRMDHLALLAEADVRGRTCTDKQDLLERIDLFRAFCQECQCYQSPFSFTTSYSRFVYFHSMQADPHYAAYDDTTFEVILLSGLPGAGKDTWIRTHLSDLPLISLDQIRSRLKIGPEEKQGKVVQDAREQARVLLRQHRSFVWNATNVTRTLRQQLINLFVSYGARVRLIYLEVPLSELLQRNAKRDARIPEAVLYRLINKLEVPDSTEAHSVEWYTNI
ncbi:HDc and NK domain-containing protein [Ktedonobacteria bacterium brp13]|nr:HDc and NK domain-containing protein [Ktedonobacteria bacterium brp13]